MLGASGASCAQACGDAKRACAPEGFALLAAPAGGCDRLREHAPCEAGCAADAPEPWHPGYVDGKAPKAQRPAVCAATKEGATPAANCDAKAAHVQRLCACSK